MDDDEKKKHTLDTLFLVWCNHKVGFVYQEKIVTISVYTLFIGITNIQWDREYGVQ